MFSLLFPQPDPDAALVAAARSGDVRAFDALVYRYQGPMTLFVRARLDAAIDSDDVAQDIFVAAWQQLPRFQGRSRFKTWLFGIAVNRCAEAGRKYQRLKAALGGLAERADEWPEPEWTPTPWEWSAERAEVQRRLAELPEAEREVLELYYYAQLNLPEISKLLAVNLSTLKYRFYQGHARLRSQLEGRDTPAMPAVCGRKRK